MPPRKHARLAPSSSERWMNCLGAPNLESQQPEGGSSRYADEGTAAHMLAEKCLRQELDPATFLGTSLLVEDDLWEVTDEMVESVEVFVEAVRAVRASNTQLFIEHAIDLSLLNGKLPKRSKHQFGIGTVDAAVWNPETKALQTFDLKYGKGVEVDATENSQQLMYLLGLVLALQVKPRLMSCTIVQPRKPHPQGAVRTYSLDWDTLVAFKQELVRVGVGVNQKDAPLKTGDHCQFCRARAVCPAQLALAKQVMQDDFADSVALPVVRQDVKPPAPESLSPATLAFVLTQADTMRGWLNAIEEYVQGLIESGNVVPGWKVVSKVTRRRWRNEGEAKEWMNETGFETPYQDPKLLSPAQAEAQLKKLYPAGMRPSLPDEIVLHPAGANTLAPEHDKRPSVVSAASDDFVALPPPGDET